MGTHDNAAYHSDKPLNSAPGTGRCTITGLRLPRRRSTTITVVHLFCIALGNPYSLLFGRPVAGRRHVRTHRRRHVHMKTVQDKQGVQHWGTKRPLNTPCYVWSLEVGIGLPSSWGGRGRREDVVMTTQAIRSHQPLASASLQYRDGRSDIDAGLSPALAACSQG